ncbi:unnamed protein product (macronuclear) [Paramecium tetraurelia]|uniref:Tetratricopeptide repeat protein n=1 Tax=Paramecium tetraurelia TaxID=5888 RepID=A0BGU0_PARTE|nr:uncharacterized protein GSPATT00028792001 [Paramecium tetraurelia]CAK57757.1 unnamed protein product [Paramecium tetraurelia]|eukprot:XP_001425155.1 hypothetical protein (macronuclear) [Paramecium tetraurelia strain d4-2]
MKYTQIQSKSILYTNSHIGNQVIFFHLFLGDLLRDEKLYQQARQYQCQLMKIIQQPILEQVLIQQILKVNAQLRITKRIKLYHIMIEPFRQAHLTKFFQYPRVRLQFQVFWILFINTELIMIVRKLERYEEAMKIYDKVQILILKIQRHMQQKGIFQDCKANIQMHANAIVKHQILIHRKMIYYFGLVNQIQLTKGECLTLSGQYQEAIEYFDKIYIHNSIICLQNLLNILIIMNLGYIKRHKNIQNLTKKNQQP